jgi:hypothetical protein
LTFDIYRSQFSLNRSKGLWKLKKSKIIKIGSVVLEEIATKEVEDSHRDFIYMINNFSRLYLKDMVIIIYETIKATQERQ